MLQGSVGKFLEKSHFLLEPGLFSGFQGGYLYCQGFKLRCIFHRENGGTLGMVP